MELALVVYLVNLVVNIKDSLVLINFLLGVALLISGVFLILIDKNGWVPSIRENVLNYVFLPKTFAFVILLNFLIPSEKTMQYMAGGYLVQTVYTSEFVNKAAPLAQKAVLNQLEVWAKDNDQVKELLSTVVPTIPAVVEQVK